ncbi:hypothetical protein ABK040_007747 [Willaertia magna]
MENTDDDIFAKSCLYSKILEFVKSLQNETVPPIDYNAYEGIKVKERALKKSIKYLDYLFIHATGRALTFQCNHSVDGGELYGGYFYRCYNAQPALIFWTYNLIPMKRFNYEQVEIVRGKMALAILIELSHILDDSPNSSVNKLCAFIKNKIPKPKIVNQINIKALIDG